MKLHQYPSYFLISLLLLLLTGCGGGSGDTDPNPDNTGTPSSLSISYDGNGSTGGQVPNDFSDYATGDSVTVLGNTGNLINPGHSFVSWNTQADGSGTSYLSGDQFAIGSSDVTLYAQWSAVLTFAVTYDANGADIGSVPDDASTYQSGQYVTVQGNTGNLGRSGFVMTGWNTQADGNGSGYTQGDQLVMGSSDLTLYAQWSTNPTYTLTYDGNGSSGGSAPVDSFSYEAGRTVTLLGNTGGLTNPGYSFTGWNTEADGSGSSYLQGDQLTMGAADIRLYAQWSLNPTWAVVYDSNNHTAGVVPVDSNRYEETWSVAVLGNTGNLERFGYTFAGWNTQMDGSGSGYVAGGQFLMGTSDIILYAQWNANPTYTLTYDGNGNTGGSVPIDSNHYEDQALVTVLSNSNNLERDGYSFTGWSTQADGNGTSYVQGNQFTMSANDLTLYAKWEANPTYSAVYYGNGNDGGSVPIDSTEYEQGVAVTVLSNSGNLTRSGHTFSGWNTAADGSATAYVQGDQFNMPLNGASLYAQWTQNPTYTVTYNGNGNSGGSVPVDTTHYEQNDTVTVLGNSGSLTRTNYAFNGWNTLPDGSGSAYSQAQTFSMATADITLYAQWTYRPTYTVSYAAYDYASGSVPVDTMRYEEGQTVTVLGNTGNLVPIDSNKVFHGWLRDATGYYTYYYEGDTFTMSAANERLAAIYANAETITVRYDGNGNTSGSVPASPTVYNSGVWLTAAENTGNLQRSGHLFVGWYTVITQEGGSSSTSPVYPGGPVMIKKEAPLAQTLTLYAKWVPRSSMLYNAGTHTGNFGGLAGANALCEANVHPACGPRTKIRALLDPGYSTSETIGDIPALMGIDANLPILSSWDRQISANWAGLTNGIDMTLAAAGVIPNNTHWWSGGGVSNYADEFYSSYSVCATSSGGPWTTSAPSVGTDRHWGAGGSSSTTDREDWVNEITTVVTPLPGGGTSTVNYRLECSDQHYLLCVCGE